MRQSKTNALVLLLLSTSEVMWGASYVTSCIPCLPQSGCMGLTQPPEVIEKPIQDIQLVSRLSGSKVGHLKKVRRIINSKEEIVYILERRITGEDGTEIVKSVEISGDDTLDSVSTQLSYYSQFGFLIFEESQLNLKISDLFTNDSIDASTKQLSISVLVTTQYPFKIEVSDRRKQYYNETVDLKKSPNGVIELKADNGQTYKARGVIFSGRLHNEQEVRDPNTGWGVDSYDSDVIETDILVKLFKGYKLCCPPGLARSSWPHEYYNRMIEDIAVLKYPLKPKQNSRLELEAEVCLRENGEFCIIVR
jgi:hypothetical protein